jgi:curli production assembly/transport component CsgG
MTKLLTTILLLGLLSGCAVTQNDRMGKAPKPVNMPVMMQKEFDAIRGPAHGQPITVALYGFTDKTGQRRPQQNIASLSTAVTQGSETFLIKALQDVGQGRWFKVVERVGIDGLTRERQLIRQMREAYEGSNAKPLPPMTFAGIILEGGIVGYDSSVKSGGMAARWLGIGPQTQYSEDIVTVSIRAISVSSGEVLAAVTVQKTIVSAADSVAAMKFFDMGTKAFEFETGMTVNEPGTFAVKSTIEMAVLELIKEGAKRNVWAFDAATPAASPVVPPAKEQKPEPVPEKKAEPAPVPEVKKENPPAKTEPAAKAEPAVTVPVPEVKLAITEQSANPSAVDKKEVDKHLPVVYVKGTTYLYMKKDLHSKRLGWLSTGVELTVAEMDNQWATVVDSMGRHGFVRKAVLVSEKPIIRKGH